MLSEGMMLANRYEIVDKVGTGGMSDVFKAKDHILGRNVAIKVLKQEFGEDINFVTKFRTEAQAAAGLEHPNIVNIYDVGSENKMHYIVMEYIEGITLKTYIEKRGKINFNESISIAIQVANGIRAAHNKRIVHRDIKPQNIMISTEGKVKVTDFGIARAASNNTVNSDMMGSVHYTSPEQARNGFVDYKSDIYSLGIVMYEMVTGKVPFSGDSAVSIAIQHLQEDITLPSKYAVDIPISLEKIILKCTQKSPDRRYNSMDELIADLKNALISPDEDFVTIVPIVNQDKTRIISPAEIDKIKSETNESYYKTLDEDLEGNDVEDEEDDEDEEDGILSPKMEKAVTIMTIAIVVVIVGIIIAIVGNVLGWFKFGSNDKEKEPTKPVVEQEEKKVEMIEIVGLDIEKASEQLRKLGLGIRVKEMKEDDKFKENEIIRQSVKKGEKVEKNTTIDVIVCSGEKGIEVDNVVGKKEADAKATLEGKGFKVTTEYQYSDTVEAGNVVSSNPVAGSLGKKDDVIKLTISRGKEDVLVPNVVGQTKETAESKLNSVGFGVTSTTQTSDTISQGKVISQSVEGGKKAAPGTVIALVISIGKKENTYKGEYTLKLPPEDPYKDATEARVQVLINGVVKPEYSATYPDLTKSISIKIESKDVSVPTATIEIEWWKDGSRIDPKQSINVPLTQAN